MTEITYIHRDELTPGFEDQFRHTPRSKLTGGQADRFDALKKNLLANGLKHPLIVFEGHILVGSQRYEALRDTLEYFPCVSRGTWTKPVNVVHDAALINKQVDTGQLVVPRRVDVREQLVVPPVDDAEVEQPVAKTKAKAKPPPLKRKLRKRKATKRPRR